MTRGACDQHVTIIDVVMLACLAHWRVLITGNRAEAEPVCAMCVAMFAPYNSLQGQNVASILVASFLLKQPRIDTLLSNKLQTWIAS